MAASVNSSHHPSASNTATKSPSSPREPNDQYSDRLPSPPHINIPIAAFSGEPPPPHFVATPDGLFDACSLGPGWTSSEWADWEYSRRHEAQEILPFLFLGPTSTAKDPAYLRAHSITMTVVVRHARPGQLPVTNLAAARVAAQVGAQCMLVDVSDNQGLAARFADVGTAITGYLRACKGVTGTLGRVLITDDSGNERAAALVVAYVMEVTDYGLVRACQLVQRRRFCTNVDDALRFTLSAYEDVLRARRDVVRGSARLAVQDHPGGGAARSSSKRSRDVVVADEDGDVAMGSGGAAAGFAGVGRVSSERDGRDFTPFADG